MTDSSQSPFAEPDWAISAIPLAIDIAVGAIDGSLATHVPIARFGDTGRYVAIDCRLEAVDNQANIPAERRFHDFSFSISSNDPGANEFWETQERAIAARLIPDKTRPLIIPIVIASLKALLDETGPVPVYRVAKENGANAKMLRKHHAIRGPQGARVRDRRAWN